MREVATRLPYYGRWDVENPACNDGETVCAYARVLFTAYKSLVKVRSGKICRGNGRVYLHAARRQSVRRVCRKIDFRIRAV